MTTVPALVVALHFLTSVCAAALLHRKLLSGPPGWSFALVFSAALFVPVLGLVGMAAVALGAPRDEPAPEPDCILTRIPRPPGPGNDPREGFRHGADRKARIDALAALRGRTDPRAVALLRRGLRDREEDVRLLAHALLESKSRAACRAIDETSRSLRDAAPSRQGALHRRLAFQHWEVARLGLVQGECLAHALASARGHALSALEQDPGSHPVHLLLGQIELRLEDPARAEAALVRACELGVSRAVAAPYLAEAAFLRRRFDLVRTRLADAQDGALARVRRYWG
jgi:polysaccharide biosynthesis protein PelE